MKFNKIVLGSLLVLGLGACNNENGTRTEDVKDIVNPAHAQFSLILGNSNGAKSSTTVRDTADDVGTSAEQNVTNITIWFVNQADGSLAHQEVIQRNQLTPGTATPDADLQLAYTTPVFQVPAGSYDVYAGINMGNYNPFTLGQNFDTLALYNGKANDIATDGRFMMSNYRDSRVAVSLDSSVHTANNPLRMSIDVERVVAKVEYNPQRPNRSFQFALRNSSGQVVDSVPTTLVAMEVANTNTQCYIFGRRNGNYVVDPNFGQAAVDPALSPNNTQEPTLSLGSQGAPAYPVSYCLENTDEAQIDGSNTKADHFTGVFFQAFHRPNPDCFLRGNGVVVDSTREADGTFYAYNNYLFANRTEFLKYYGQNNPDLDSAAVMGLLDDIASAGDDHSRFGYINTLSSSYFVSVYHEGHSYYLPIIGHSPLNNPSDGVMDPMEYAVVRNYWYKVAVTNISGFGDVTPTIPSEPVEDADANIQVEISIQPWHVVINDFEL